ncbi:MAG: hypothetical protein QM783_01535 [Phycisphaerales bacterium]
MVVLYDRNASGLWVRVPGTLPTTMSRVMAANRPIKLNTDGTELIVCGDGAVSFYSRAAGSAAGTPFGAGASFAPLAGESGASIAAVSTDGAMLRRAAAAIERRFSHPGFAQSGWCVGRGGEHPTLHPARRRRAARDERRRQDVPGPLGVVDVLG